MNRQSFDAVLGIFVSQDYLDVFLVECLEGYRTGNIYKLSTNRQASLEGNVMLGGSSVGSGGLFDGGATDFSMEIGGQQYSAYGEGKDLEPFIHDGLDGDGNVKKLERTAFKATVFTNELLTILNKSHQQGFKKILIAYCVREPEVSYEMIQIGVSDSDSQSQKSDAGGILDQFTAWMSKDTGTRGRKGKVFDHLNQHIPFEYDKERVATLNVATSNGDTNTLAIVPREPDSITATLRDIPAKEVGQLPAGHILDSELSLFVSILSYKLPDNPHFVTTLLRIGKEETLVVFMKGQTLYHFERLSNLSVFDSGATICSRVQLIQDEQRLFNIDRFYVISSEPIDGFEISLEQFFSDAHVGTIESLLDLDERLNSENSSLTPNEILALSSAVRFAEGWDVKSSSPPLNLLPSKLMVKGTRQSIGTLVFLLLTGLVVLESFFLAKYFLKEKEIDQRKIEYSLSVPGIPLQNAGILKERVDSLKQVYARNTRSLRILDSLLYGSDKYTRHVAQLSSSTGEIKGLWIRSFASNKTGTSVQMSGSAMSRSRIADLARKMNASIGRVQTRVIGRRKVYDFSMVAPIDNKMPEVVTYLQELAAQTTDPEPASELVNSSANE